MRVALDAMGGDYAPQTNIDGAIAALERFPELEVLLVGDRDRLENLLDEAGVARDRLTVVPASQVVEMGEKPSVALRSKPDSSIAVCWRLLARRAVDAVVSAGNTGAVVACGLGTRQFLRGVRRPGIAVALPTQRGRCALIDAGANPMAKPEHLLQYAVMGSVYARRVLGIDRPRIGLINIGSEEGKGNELYRETHRLISDSPLAERYVGNVEGRDLFSGVADVVVCEGFVGNVVLKASEGMAQFLVRTLADYVLSRLDRERMHAADAFQEISRRFQYNEEGGAPLLGIDGICIICHGSSDARSISNALKVAMTFDNRGINAAIREELSKLAGKKR